MNAQPWLGNKGVRVLDRGTRLLCIAAQIALTETGLSQEAETQVMMPVSGMICGTMFGGVRIQHCGVRLDRNPTRMDHRW